MNLKNLTEHISLVERRPRFVTKHASIHCGRLNEEEEVAVKVFKITTANNTLVKSIRLRIDNLRDLWARLDHPNILPFLGFSEDIRFRPFGASISPWCSYGAADGFLAQHRGELSVYSRIDLWKDVIAGLGYLHSQRPVLIHGNLKMRNVLIDKFRRAVLCDFGQAGVFPDEESRVTTGRTLKSEKKPPKITSDHVNTPVGLTFERDLYDLGCLGFEFIFDQKVSTGAKQNPEEGIFNANANETMPPEQPSSLTAATLKPWKLILSCWDPDPVKRPLASQMQDNLRQTSVRLPQDILFLIFTMIASIPLAFSYSSHASGQDWSSLRKEYDDKWRHSSSTLVTLSLVGKEWNATAVPLLYRRMRLRTEAQISNAAETLEYRHQHPTPWIGSPHGSFTTALDVGTTSQENMLTSIIVNLHVVVLHTPNLRSYRTCTHYVPNDRTDNSRHASRIIPSLRLRGSTMLEILDLRFLAPDLTSLVKGLAQLDTLVISTMILLELEHSRNQLICPTLRTLIIAEPHRAIQSGLCLNEHTFDIVSGWDLPNLESIFIHDHHTISHLLNCMAQFVSAHQGQARQIAFRRCNSPYSSADVALLRDTFPKFRNMVTTADSVHFSKHSIK